MNLNIKNETAKLKAVAIGESKSSGKTPTLEQTYDSKSYESVKNDTYPSQESIDKEMNSLEAVLIKHNVKVLKPWLIEDCNQVYARDVAFVIDNKIINSNIITDRIQEKKAYSNLFKEIDSDNIYNLPEKAFVEGGDVVLYNDIIFVGTGKDSEFENLKTSRTNAYAIDCLRELFPKKEFITFELVKHDRDPRLGILHLDCTFMPVSRNKAIIYKDGFIKNSDYQLIVDIFGKDNLFEVTKEEMYYMNTNVFSISPSVVISEENFTRLNNHMINEWNMTVETIPYHEISKMGGLLRCSTLPLIREAE